MPLVRSIVAAALVSVVLVSCQSRSMIALPLLPPNAWSGGIQVTQLVSITQGGKKWQNTVVMALSAEDITIVSLTPLGQRLFTARYDQGQNLLVTMLIDGQKIPVRQILSLMQLALWPAPELDAAYSDEWGFESTGDQRSATFRGQEVIRIQLADWRFTCSGLCAEQSKQWPFRIHIQNLQADLAMDIETLEYERL